MVTLVTVTNYISKVIFPALHARTHAHVRTRTQVYFHIPHISWLFPWLCHLSCNKNVIMSWVFLHVFHNIVFKHTRCQNDSPPETPSEIFPLLHPLQTAFYSKGNEHTNKETFPLNDFLLYSCSMCCVPGNMNATGLRGLIQTSYCVNNGVRVFKLLHNAGWCSLEKRDNTLGFSSKRATV